MDLVKINQLVCQVRLGVTDEERGRPQTIHVDVALEIDLDAAAHTDDLTLTVDYQRLAKRIRSELEGGAFKLLEAVAGRVCTIVLAEPKAEKAHVRVRKFPDSMRQTAESVEVEMVRGR